MKKENTGYEGLICWITGIYAKVTISEEEKDSINEALELFLDKSQLELVNKRFGINGEGPHTLEELGTIYNLKREKIRKLLLKAQNRLNSSSRIKFFLTFSTYESATDFPQEIPRDQDLVVDCGLSTRASNVLQNNLGIEHIHELKDITKRRLSGQKQVGPKTLAEIEKAMKEHGVSFRKERK
ncbi:MAG: hypothetical protein NTW06_04520 [Candidatus Falkowbacteria bacterium]|nr:hypothetical protein [Candidatus Falkowbacteria bacterium]